MLHVRRDRYRAAMRENTFKPGDKVELKTGGPPMTVSTVNSDKVSCVWWDQPKQAYAERDFISVVLKPWVVIGEHGGYLGTEDD